MRHEVYKGFLITVSPNYSKVYETKGFGKVIHENNLYFSVESRYNAGDVKCVFGEIEKTSSMFEQNEVLKKSNAVYCRLFVLNCGEEFKFSVSPLPDGYKQIGFIYAMEDDIREFFNTDIVTDKMRRDAYLQFYKTVQEINDHYNKSSYCTYVSNNMFEPVTLFKDCKTEQEGILSAISFIESNCIKYKVNA